MVAVKWAESASGSGGDWYIEFSEPVALAVRIKWVGTGKFFPGAEAAKPLCGTTAPGRGTSQSVSCWPPDRSIEHPRSSGARLMESPRLLSFKCLNVIPALCQTITDKPSAKNGQARTKRGTAEKQDIFRFSQAGKCREKGVAPRVLRKWYDDNNAHCGRAPRCGILCRSDRRHVSAGWLSG